jgi:hypothetical protein
MPVTQAPPVVLSLRGSSQLAAEPRSSATAGGMNRASVGSNRAVVVVLCVRVTCTLAENDIAGAPLQGSAKVASRTGPGTAPCGTRIQPR